MKYQKIVLSSLVVLTVLAAERHLQATPIMGDLVDSSMAPLAVCKIDIIHRSAMPNGGYLEETGLCSATRRSESVFLTAKHCLDIGKIGRSAISASVSCRTGTGAWVTSEIDLNTWIPHASADLALVRSKQPFEDSVPKLMDVKNFEHWIRKIDFLDCYAFGFGNGVPTALGQESGILRGAKLTDFGYQRPVNDLYYMRDIKKHSPIEKMLQEMVNGRHELLFFQKQKSGGESFVVYPGDSGGFLGCTDAQHQWFQLGVNVAHSEDRGIAEPVYYPAYHDWIRVHTYRLETDRKEQLEQERLEKQYSRFVAPVDAFSGLSKKPRVIFEPSSQPIER